MRILLISSAFNGMTQRFYTELDDAGYTVSVELHTGDLEQLANGVSLFKPDLILCPFLTRKITSEIFDKYLTLIVHPGIKGDRGPSSLDWAIQEGETEWGVSFLQAKEEMDAGDIWASRTFPLRATTKSSVYNREVSDFAIDCLWEVLTYLDAPDFTPEPLDYQNPEFKGRLRPMMRQKDRAINWSEHTTEEILRKIHAADGSPGVLDNINGQGFYLFNAHRAENLSGKPGQIVATSNKAICRATKDGAIWIGHLKAGQNNGSPGIKLPALDLLRGKLPQPTKDIVIDYTQPGRQLLCQEIWFETEGKVAYLYSPFHNGAFSTEQCRLFLRVYQHIVTLPVDAIVLMGGEESWSNGIHLNQIQHAADPARESWQNINAIDDIVYQIINTLDKVTISAVAGNAGAGGAMVPLATDLVFAREGVLFNPHYKNMGGLFGSEYWTYVLPKRVGPELAKELTEKCLPISAKKAWRIGFVDRILDRNHDLFRAQVKHLAAQTISDRARLIQLLNEKANTRCRDESQKPLAAYRKFELVKMFANFYGNDHYHTARKAFVYKSANHQTPLNIAIHRNRRPRLRLFSQRA